MQTSLYQEEFDRCRRLLHFPEEVALILTETEHALFIEVPPASYVRQVTNNRSQGPEFISGDETGSETVKDLHLRFREVIVLHLFSLSVTFFKKWVNVLVSLEALKMVLETILIFIISSRDETFQSD